MSASPGAVPLPRLDLLVREIEAALVGKDRARQSELVSRSAAALTRHWSRLPRADKPSFDRLLASLLDQVDVEARATFARCLLPLRRAPRGTTTRLACDPSLAVAAPLLELCPSFDDEWLLQIARCVGKDHHAAICRRRTIGPAVTMTLLEAGDPAVAVALLNNPGAALAVGMLERLLPNAVGSLPLMLALARRADVPEAGRLTLAGIARQSAALALTEEAGFNGEDAAALLEHVTRTFRRAVCPERLARHAVFAAVADKDPGAKPASSSRLADWLERRRLEDVLAILARDVDLPVGIVIACHDAPSPHAITIIMRGLGHPWSLLKSLLHVAAGGATSPDSLEIAHRLHCDIAPRTARMVARDAAIQAGTGAFVAAASSDDRHHVSLLARSTDRTM